MMYLCSMVSDLSDTCRDFLHIVTDVIFSDGAIQANQDLTEIKGCHARD